MASVNSDYGSRRDLPPARLAEELFAHLFAGCQHEHYRAGHNLFLQDDPAERVFGVVAGTVEIAIYAESGRKLIANIETERSLIGEIGALDGGKRSATATCLTDCLLVSVSRRQLFDRIEQHRGLATAMIGFLCLRLRWISSELGDQALLKIEARLAKRLAFLAMVMGDENGWIKISQSDLAEFLGATRESVNKTLTDWRRIGVIGVRRGGIRIVNARALERIGAGPDD